MSKTRHFFCGENHTFGVCEDYEYKHGLCITVNGMTSTAGDWTQPAFADATYCGLFQ